MSTAVFIVYVAEFDDELILRGRKAICTAAVFGLPQIIHVVLLLVKASDTGKYGNCENTVSGDKWRTYSRHDVYLKTVSLILQYVLIAFGAQSCPVLHKVECADKRNRNSGKTYTKQNFMVKTFNAIKNRTG